MRPNSPIQRLGRKSRIIFKNELANTAKFSAPTFNALSQNRNLLTQRNIKVLKEDHLEAMATLRIVIDDLRDSIHQFNDEFCHEVTWRRLSAENHSAGNHLNAGIRFNAVIEGDDIENIQQLTFVLVNPLHLNIKNGVWIYFDAIVLLDIFCQFHFVGVLNSSPVFAELGIVDKFFDLLDLF